MLTRLPAPSRLTPLTAGRVILHNFPDACPGPSDDALSLVERFAELGVAGGAVYDGLVALAAHDDQRLLLTRDQRAERTYRRLAVEFELLVGPA